ncbi:Cyclin PHO80-like [Phaffia rhodozyma]|uniref:Cyclin PHO80-like n=1 Tax=Phaffia rhodozyma TaxID=264483 RepID=A0A0F7SMV3_PHARH|nr:Cyclin PHO80-like [Phaffia rhodozyma]
MLSVNQANPYLNTDDEGFVDLSSSVEPGWCLCAVPTGNIVPVEKHAHGPFSGLSSLSSGPSSLSSELSSTTTSCSSRSPSSLLSAEETDSWDENFQRTDPDELSESTAVSGPSQIHSRIPLDLNNKAQMYELMETEATLMDCELAIDMIQILLPRLTSRSMPADQIRAEREALARHLFHWTSMTLHPLVVLICTIWYIELLKAIHPLITTTGRIQDTALRVIFSSFLLATKMISDACYANIAFVRRTPWSLEEINSMEAEMLGHIQYKSYIPPCFLLCLAKAFWAHQETGIVRARRDNTSSDGLE